MSQQEHASLVDRTLERLSIRPDLTLWKLSAGVGRSLYGQRVIRFGIEGGADIIGIAAPAGRWIAIECKVGRDSLRRKQKTFRDVILSHGGIHIVAYSVDEAERALDHNLLQSVRCAS